MRLSYVFQGSFKLLFINRRQNAGTSLVAGASLVTGSVLLLLAVLSGCDSPGVSPNEKLATAELRMISEGDKDSSSKTKSGDDEVLERAVLAGGCFWGMQDLIRKLPGVVSTRVGYTGGDVKNATYRNHGTHAEGIEIMFDPQKTDYRKLLEFFFQIHDPTTLNRQGNDRGASYRSAIYYTSDEQKKIAIDTIADVNASGLWPGKVVTEVEPVGDFWEAEPEHQDYLERNPGGYTCHFPRPNWVLPKRGETISK